MNNLENNTNTDIDIIYDDNVILNNEDINTKIKDKIKHKNKRFPEQRNNILNTIYNILEINNINKRFTAKKAEEKSEEILALSNEILMYFSCSTWSAFTPLKI